MEVEQLNFDFDKTKFKTNEIPLFIKELVFDSSKNEYHFFEKKLERQLI